jgi:hypothetical protein
LDPNYFAEDTGILGVTPFPRGELDGGLLVARRNEDCELVAHGIGNHLPKDVGDTVSPGDVQV